MSEAPRPLTDIIQEFSSRVQEIGPNDLNGDRSSIVVATAKLLNVLGYPDLGEELVPLDPFDKALADPHHGRVTVDSRTRQIVPSRKPGQRIHTEYY